MTDGTLPLLRVKPFLGRFFTADDDSPRTPERVLLNHAYWERKFGRDAEIVGKSVTLDGRPHEIIGVLPPAFSFLDEQVQIVMPFRINRSELHVAGFNYQGVARLKPGVTIEQANADIARLIPVLADRFPMPEGFTRQMFDDVKMGPNVRPLADDVIGDVGQVLWILLGTVGLVLLIACANVANLFLVRAEARQQELAIHAALGAGTARIARALLAESMTLGLLGGAVGLALAYAGVRLLVANAPDGLPRVAEIGLDPVVLLFTLAISLFSGLLFGLIPVLKFASPNLARALKEGGRLSSAGRDRHRARNALVVAEIALAVVLLIGSGLMMRTFQAMRDVQPGFTSPEEVVTFRVSIRPAIVRDDEQAIRTHEQIARRLEQIPGVTSVGLASSITMDGFDSNDPIFIEDSPAAPDKLPPLRRFKWTTENYLRTMGNRLVAGREFTWADSYTRAPVVMVSENFAREVWKEPAGALGRRIRQTPKDQWRTIVGVVGDERDNGVAKPAPTTIYWPLLIANFYDNKSFAQRNLAFAVRTGRAGSPTLLKELQAGRVVGQREPAGRERSDARTDPRRLDGADVIRPGDARHRRRGGAAAGGGRDLRRDLLRRVAADARDRHSHRARRRQPRRQPAVRPARAAARRDRGHVRPGRRGADDAGDVGAALRRQRPRSGDLRRGRAGARRDGGPGQLPSGAASGARRSGGGATRF